MFGKLKGNTLKLKTLKACCMWGMIPQASIISLKTQT